MSPSYLSEVVIIIIISMSAEQSSKFDMNDYVAVVPQSEYKMCLDIKVSSTYRQSRLVHHYTTVLTGSLFTVQ
jgi:hypothetical protein